MSPTMTPEFLTVPQAEMLYRALSDEGNPALLKEWLALGVDVNDPRLADPQGLGLFPYGSPLLSIACSRNTENHLAMTRLLLDAGADPRQHVNGTGYTPLMLCLSQSANPTMVRLVIDAGDDVNAQTDSGWRAVHSAVTNNQLEALDFMCQRGADLTARFKGSTVFHLACDSKATTDWLVRRVPMVHEVVNVVADEGQTALQLAIAGGQIGVVQALVAAGADPHLRFLNVGKEYNAFELAQGMRKFEIADWLTAWDCAHSARQVIEQIRNKAPGRAPA